MGRMAANFLVPRPTPVETRGTTLGGDATEDSEEESSDIRNYSCRESGAKAEKAEPVAARNEKSNGGRGVENLTRSIVRVGPLPPNSASVTSITTTRTENG